MITNYTVTADYRTKHPFGFLSSKDTQIDLIKSGLIDQYVEDVENGIVKDLDKILVEAYTTQTYPFDSNITELNKTIDAKSNIITEYEAELYDAKLEIPLAKYKVIETQIN